MNTPRPTPPPLPSPEQVPAELRSLKRWCCWSAVLDESKGKWRKPPYSPITGEGIGATEKYREHFVTFDQALAAATKYELDGVGFVFMKGDGYVGIDFDNCRDPKTEELDPEVVQWLKWFPTYVEVSPSGTGIHIIGKATIPRTVTAQPIGKQGATVEIYDRDRYFTFTGKSFTVLEVKNDCRLPN